MTPLMDACAVSYHRHYYAINDPVDGRLGGTIDDPVDGRRHKERHRHTWRGMRGS